MISSIGKFLIENHGIYKQNIKPGIKVTIVTKEQQRLPNETTKGIVKRVLTKKRRHTRGIKVELKSGEVGRVKEIHK